MCEVGGHECIRSDVLGDPYQLRIGLKNHLIEFIDDYTLSNDMRLSARQIELFRMAYRHRSTRRAAEALNVSQPAISRAVSEIEREMGVALFDRSGRGFEPTAAAHGLHQAVLRHYQGLDQVREAARTIAAGFGGHLRVATIPSVADSRAAPAAGILMEEHPSLRIDLDVMSENGALSALRAGQVDCAVISSDEGDPNIAATRLADISPVVIVPRKDPLSGRKRISVAELASEPLLLLPTDSPFRRAVDLMFDRKGITCRVRAEARTQTALVRMVAQGAGRAIVDREILNVSGDSGAIRLALDTDMVWPIRLATLSASSGASWFRRYLDALLRVQGSRFPGE